MEDVSRRRFLSVTAAAAGAALASARGLSRDAAAPPGRRMTLDLRCGSIGVSADQAGAADLAQRHGFESVEARGDDLARLSGDELREFLASLESRGLVLSAAGLPVDFRGEEARFREGMQRLDAFARALERAGVTRAGTWISPAHRDLTYYRNFKQHARRLKEIARALGAHGVRFGLEYVGPKTSWTRFQHPFVHTLAETRDLIGEIDEANVGLVLDSWHWYNARETVADLEALSNRDVVAVDLNDAPRGVPIDEQQDNRRELPAATGVIDTKGFLGALQAMGYDGPVRAEPFNRELNELGDDEAAAATIAALRKAFALL